jgi:hypothetical protein
MQLTNNRGYILTLWRQNRKPLLVFAMFVASIFLFAGIYRHLYLTQPESFWFNQDIAKSQYGLSKARHDLEQREGAAEIARLNAKLAVVNAVSLEFMRSPAALDFKHDTAESHSGYVVSVHEEAGGSGGDPAPSLLFVSIFDPAGKELLVNERLYWVDPPVRQRKCGLRYWASSGLSSNRKRWRKMSEYEPKVLTRLRQESGRTRISYTSAQ